MSTELARQDDKEGSKVSECRWTGARTGREDRARGGAEYRFLAKGRGVLVRIINSSKHLGWGSTRSLEVRVAEGKGGGL